MNSADQRIELHERSEEKIQRKMDLIAVLKKIGEFDRDLPFISSYFRPSPLTIVSYLKQENPKDHNGKAISQADISNMINELYQQLQWVTKRSDVNLRIVTIITHFLDALRVLHPDYSDGDSEGNDTLRMTKIREIINDTLNLGPNSYSDKSYYQI